MGTPPHTSSALVHFNLTKNEGKEHGWDFNSSWPLLTEVQISDGQNYHSAMA